MADSPDLFTVLQRFSRTLVTAYELTDVLHELTEQVVTLLGATGAGVSVADSDKRLRFATVSDERFSPVEHAQEDHQCGPCYQAYTSGEVVKVADLRGGSRWPPYEDIALETGLVAVMGVPMQYREQTIGALNVYDSSPRQWSNDDVGRATVLADLATAYVANSVELDAMRRVNGQLHRALESRVLIEQAKGVLAGEQSISVDEAFDRLRGHARTNNVTLRSVAERVVNDRFRPA